MHRVATVFLVGGAVDPVSAQHVHRQVSPNSRAKPYDRRFLTVQEFAAIERLSELIIPADAISGSARDAGAPAFIDLLCSVRRELGLTYREGLAWFDSEMQSRYSKRFVSASATEQEDLLLKLAAADPSVAPGRRFWILLRRMVVDAFYSSPLGIHDLGFQGNTSSTKFVVPQHILEHALRKSPFS
jgi:hypothetical protein